MEVDETVDKFSWTEKPLFGGSMICLLPDNCIDVSDLREVPDHQEVFCHKETEQNIIIDILEYQQHAQREEAPRFHFLDVAEANESTESSDILAVEAMEKDAINMKECVEAWFLYGTQEVSKFNEGITSRKKINVYLGLFRLPQFTTDILITMNDPDHTT
eukprot:Seg234.3 transcript_id=Seg234.3/GoldUCD/mRNA.D3Y31 product="Ran guanine nucleotide release factor" protein_id=Seg234.3/GoldUCD/D3Y31